MPVGCKKKTKVLCGLCLLSYPDSREQLLEGISQIKPDVNECSTEMLLCDAHADCFNDFGTYACRCQDGFEDRSRAGLGGTICVNVAGMYLTKCVFKN
ncbi:UNVERIFIED_CONTAM: hypothetical protein FKN15_017483 [Acipenser sinensis]